MKMTEDNAKMCSGEHEDGDILWDQMNGLPDHEADWGYRVHNCGSE